jgi:uncharacterized protein (TIGR00369 family)
MMDAKAPVDKRMLEEALCSVFAEWVRQLDLSVLEARIGEVLLSLPVTPKHVHIGNAMSGQSLMAAADTAMVLAVMTHLGSFKPMTTVQLQTSFLRPVRGDAGSVTVKASVLRMGRNLVFGEIHIHTADGQLAAHATTTYALL